MKKQILCTLGPSSMDEQTIKRLGSIGVNMFRINLSHTPKKDITKILTYVKNITHIPICIDTEGAQIRNGTIKNKSVIIHEHTIVKIHGKAIIGDETQFNLYPEYVIKELIIGDIISIDFDLVLLQVTEICNDTVLLRVLNGGEMGQCKAVTVHRSIDLPPLTKKDKYGIKIAYKMGINHFALSFANHPNDVDLIRSISGEGAFIISKIESRNGYNNLNKIVEKSDAILIDRGDLSREYPIERIPSLQNRIIDKCNKSDTPVYVATNLLETMITENSPTRAEVNDVYTTLERGADGLVLAAETAVGKNPIRCVRMINKIIHSFEIEDKKLDEEIYYDNPQSLLIEPHGGRLISRFGNDKEIRNADSLFKVKIKQTDLMDCEQIANGTYSPITGFMNQETLYSVLESNRLPNGNIWTMPIILQLTFNEKSLISSGDRVGLTDNNNTVCAILDITEIYKINMQSVAKSWFGTTSINHPGVARFMERGENCVAGDITMIQQPPSMYSHYQLTPAQTRFLFDHKGWNIVIGFHTRNPAHRVHEYIQQSALKDYFADGLYISPIIGPRKSGDFLPNIVMDSYQMLIEKGIYPENKVVLGSFYTYPRYCGPRETVFTMLCRKNMGCSHFIIGRDHTGVGNFYGSEENEKFL